MRAEAPFREPVPDSAAWPLVCAGLVWMALQILWSRLLGTVTGGGLTAALATTTAFFLGFAAGALLPRRGGRARVAAVALSAAAAYGLALTLAWSRLAVGLSGITSEPVRLGAGVALLVPGFLLAGQGVPSLYALAGPGRGYAAVTAGSAAGGLLLLAVIAPRAGLTGAAILLALLSLAVSVTLLRRFHGGAKTEVSSPQGVPSWPARARLLLGLSGLSSLLHQSAALVVVGQGLGGTVYSYAGTLCVFLLANAAGAAWVRRRPALTVPVLTSGVSGAILLSLAVLALLSGFPPARVHAAGVGGELVRVAAVFVAPAFAMGALFTRLLESVPAQRLSCACAVNALGAAAAPALGWLLLSLTGRYAAGIAVSLAGYAVLALLARGSGPRPGVVTRLAPALCALAALAPWPLSIRPRADEWRELSRRETLHGTVLVREPAGGPASARALQVDLFHMGGRATFAEWRMGHLAALLHPAPRRVLMLGVGTGATAGSLLGPDLERLEAVELVPEVLSALPLFASVNHGLASDPRAHLRAADARAAVRGPDEPFDLVVADLFHPGRDGAALLYTVEHFRAVRARLRPGGVFVQWLPLYQLDAAGLDMIARSFALAFDGGGRRDVWLGIYNAAQPCLALSWSDRAEPPSAGEVAARLRESAGAGMVIPDAVDLGASWLGDLAAVLPASSRAATPVNRDLDPVLLFHAPGALRLGEAALGPAHITALVSRYVPSASPWSAPVPGLAARRAALAAFLGLEARAAGGERLPDAFAPYLDVLALSPSFSPALGKLAALADASPPALARTRYKAMLARVDTVDVRRRYLAWARRHGEPEDVRRARGGAAAP